MNVADSVREHIQNCERVGLGKGPVTGIIAQEQVVRGILQHTDGLLEGLYAGAHMMMEASADAVALCVLSQLVQAVAHLHELSIGEVCLVVEDGQILIALNRVGLLRNIDCGSTCVCQVLDFLLKLLEGLLKRLGAEERREPLGCDRHTAQVEGFLQLLDIRRILMTNFTSGEASQSHLRNALLERILIAQIPHIIVGPSNRTNTQFYILVCEHCHNTSKILLSLFLSLKSRDVEIPTSPLIILG